MQVEAALESGAWSETPPITSLLDTDFYKLLMCQCIWHHRPGVRVIFQVINRSRSIRLADVLDIGELREGLEHMRSLRVTEAELGWLQGGSAWADPGLFRPEFLKWLGGVQLPPYQLDVHDGQLQLAFAGSWPSVMLWEVPVMALIMELRSRRLLRQLGRAHARALYTRAAARVREKLARLRRVGGLRLADFGTRRRHGGAWHAWCYATLAETLGANCLGTSNVALARAHGGPVVGTIGHELPQVYAALSADDVAMRRAPFEALADWQSLYAERWRIVLPDTFGMRSFLECSPPWVARWNGLRVDSGDPGLGAEAAIDWWRRHGEDPAEKRLIFSDGMDVTSMERLFRLFADQVHVVFGWGTLLANDFGGLAPHDGLAPFSLVCKAVEADGNPVVKLSDSPEKVVGPPSQLARYRRVFAPRGAASCSSTTDSGLPSHVVMHCQ